MLRLLQWLDMWRPHLLSPSAAPAPVDGFVSSAPPVSYAAPAPVIDYVAPAPSSPMQRPLLCPSSSHQHLLVLLLRPANSYVLPTPQLPFLLASTLTPSLWVLRHRSLVHFLTVKCLLSPCLIKSIRNSLLEVKFLRTWWKILLCRNR